MLRKAMAAAVTLGLLACGATVGLEAVGLLFHVSVPDPQQRIDAFVARLEADLSPVDLPTEPVDFPHEVAQDLPGGGDAERALAAAPAQAEDGSDNPDNAAESPRQAGPGGRGEERLTVAFSSPLPVPLPESAAPPDDAVTPREAVAPVPPEALEPVSEPLPAVQTPSPAPAAAQTAPRATGTRRARLVLGPAGYAAFGWPVLDWLTL
jgi:hypothetical protein